MLYNPESNVRQQPFSTIQRDPRRSAVTGAQVVQAQPDGSTAQPRPSPVAAPQPQAPQQTFAQMQAQGIPRPAPTPLPAPPVTGGPNIQSTGGLLGYPGYEPTQGYPPRGSYPSPVATGGPGVPPQPDPRAPQPAPSPVAPGGGYASAAGGMGGTLQQMLMQLMANPSSYDSAAMQREYESGARGIDDDFALQQTKLREEMARRGLADSSIQGGRLSDLNVGRRSAQVELQDRLLQKQADTRAADLRAALGLGMGFYGDEQDRAMRGAELAANREDRAADLGLRRESLGYERERDTANRALQEQEALRQFGLDRDRFDYARTDADRNYGLDRDRFDYQKQLGNDQLSQQWWELLGGLDMYGGY